MHPTGHFVTTAGLAAGVYAGTQSLGLTAGVITGGFFIDLDHYFDYLAFNKQRDLRPASFLDYYFKFKFDWIVLPLHSYELMAALAMLALYYPAPPLLGYLIGATMHMTLDLLFNDDVVESTLSFYSFVHRARMGFAKHRLLRPEAVSERQPAEGNL